MDKIDVLRNKMHELLEKGKGEEVLAVSRALDIEIANFLRSRWAIQKRDLKVLERS